MSVTCPLCGRLHHTNPRSCDGCGKPFYPVVTLDGVAYERLWREDYAVTLRICPRGAAFWRRLGIVAESTVRRLDGPPAAYLHTWEYADGRHSPPRAKPLPAWGWAEEFAWRRHRVRRRLFGRHVPVDPWAGVS